MITNRVIQEGDTVFGVYESDSTYLMVHYINKGERHEANGSKAYLDVERMFNAMEVLDRRKGRK